MTSKGPLSASTTRLMFRQFYDTYYGIFNHDAEGMDKLRPMALAAMFVQEDPWTYSLLHRYIWRFRHYELSKTYGLSLTEFFELPFYWAEALFVIEQYIAKAATKEMEERERKLKEEEAALRANQHRGLNNAYRLGR